MMDTAHFFLLLSLFWYMLLWTITDRVPFESLFSSLRTLRGLFTMFLVMVMVFQTLNIINLDLHVLFLPTMPIWIGLIVALTGMALASWAKIVMKTNWGVPAQHDITKQKSLVTSGPFAFVRNPIYLGLLLYFIGFELSLSSWLMAGVVPLFIRIRMAIAKEEVLLAKHFSKSYTAYCKNVPRFLFV